MSCRLTSSFTGSYYSRSLTAECMLHLSSSSSIRRRLQTWWPRTSSVLACVMFFSLLSCRSNSRFTIFSGTPLRCTPARTKNSEKPRCRLCVRATQTFLSPPIWPVVVLMYRTSLWLSTSRWQTPSRHMFIVSVSANFSTVTNTFTNAVNRAGRTGRAGKQGTAITFLTNDDDEVMCVFSR